MSFAIRTSVSKTALASTNIGFTCVYVVKMETVVTVQTPLLTIVRAGGEDSSLSVFASTRVDDAIFDIVLGVVSVALDTLYFTVIGAVGAGCGDTLVALTRVSDALVGAVLGVVRIAFVTLCVTVIRAVDTSGSHSVLATALIRFTCVLVNNVKFETVITRFAKVCIVLGTFLARSTLTVLALALILQARVILVMIRVTVVAASTLLLAMFLTIDTVGANAIVTQAFVLNTLVLLQMEAGVALLAKVVAVLGTGGMHGRVAVGAPALVLVARGGVEVVAKLAVHALGRVVDVAIGAGGSLAKVTAALVQVAILVDLGAKAVGVVSVAEFDVAGEVLLGELAVSDDEESVGHVEAVAGGALDWLVGEVDEIVVASVLRVVEEYYLIVAGLNLATRHGEVVLGELETTGWGNREKHGITGSRTSRRIVLVSKVIERGLNIKLNLGVIARNHIVNATKMVNLAVAKSSSVIGRHTALSPQTGVVKSILLARITLTAELHHRLTSEESGTGAKKPVGDLILVAVVGEAAAGDVELEVRLVGIGLGEFHQIIGGRLVASPGL